MAETALPIADVLPKLSRATVEYEHPLYVAWKETWKKLAHVREGTGGFLDGTYLIAHPREWEDHTIVTTVDGKEQRAVNPDPSKPTAKLKARRKIARYENFAGTILDTYKSALFRRQPTRQVGQEKSDTPSEIEQWWESVDGLESHIDDFLPASWDTAGTFGHLWFYMDKPQGQALTAADAPAPFLRVYTPLDVPDWLEDEHGNVLSVKFLEPAPRESFTQIVDLKDYRVRVVTAESWALYNRKGLLIDSGEHQMGICPVVRMYARRRSLLPQVGQTVLKDPQLFIDLFNLTSELRELLRNQTFSILNVPLGSGSDAMGVSDAEALLARSGFGTDRVLFSGLQAQFVSADAANVTVYQEERRQLIRQIYRLAGLSWESDSQDAEAEGSLKLKREDLNQQLSAFADEVEKADYAIAKLWYRATKGAAGWEAAWDKDQVSIRYPEDFDPTPFEQLLEQAKAAMSLQYPPDVLKALRKRLLGMFLPDLTEKEKKDLEAAIDAMEELSPQDQIRARIASAFGGKQPPPKEGMPPKDMPRKAGEAA